MTLNEAVAAVSPWGEPKVHQRRGGASADISTVCDRVGVQVLLEKAQRVTAVELWWPGEGRETSTRVLLEGDDVFQTPADDILQRAADRGWSVDPADGEYAYIPGVSFGFTRRTSQEVPRCPGGLPVYFTSVLVGSEDYYDFLYEGPQLT
ncbi:hypothetical protein ACH4TX_24175 [Streptomyces sp. NPDC021098]